MVAAFKVLPPVLSSSFHWIPFMSCQDEHVYFFMFVFLLKTGISFV